MANKLVVSRLKVGARIEVLEHLYEVLGKNSTEITLKDVNSGQEGTYPIETVQFWVNYDWNK